MEIKILINNLLKMIHCLSYEVYINNINIDFLNKVEVIKQYRQSVINRGNKDVFLPRVKKFQRLKILTMVAVYKKNPEIRYA